MEQKDSGRELLDQALVPEGVYDDGNRFWFMERDYNALFRVTKKDLRVKLVGTVPDEGFMRKGLYPSITPCGKRLYFAPGSAEEIAEYDLLQKNFRKIPIPIPRIEGPLLWEQAKFFGAEVTGNKIYFIPDRYPGILCYDAGRDVFFCCDEWVDEIEKLRSLEGSGYFVSYVRAGNQLILPCFCADAVVVLDMITGVSHVIKTSCTEGKFKYTGIAYAEGYFYLVTAGGTVLKRKLEAEDEEITVFPFFAQREKEIEFYPVKYAGSYLYLFPFEGNRGVKINVADGQASWEPLLDTDDPPGSCIFLPGCFMNGKMYAAARNGCSFLEYDFREKNKRKISLFSAVSDRMILRNHKAEEFKKLSGTEYVTESDAYPLFFLLGAETAKSGGRNADFPETGADVGRRIYQSVRPE